MVHTPIQCCFRTGVWRIFFLTLLLGVAGSAENIVITKGPYVQNITPFSVVIMWETDSAAPGRVDFALNTPYPSSVVKTKPVEIHEIRLSSLLPDTSYAYSVSSAATMSQTYTFHTAPRIPRSFRFAAYGDSRSYPDSHQAVVQAIIDSAPELVLHTGDLVGYGDQRELWGPEFFEPAQQLMGHIPLVPVWGNHEYWSYGRSWFSSYFSLPHNEQWFAFGYGNVRFIGLDTNVSFLPGSVQQRWFKAHVQSPAYRRATWRVVYLHHPPFTASTYGDDLDVIQYLVPLFEQANVDMVVAGHSHAYERYQHEGVHYIVTGGGGAYLVPLAEDTTPPIRIKGESVHHHCVVDVNVPDNTFALSVLRNDRTEIDTLVLLK
ncbi:metallophosphoesterase [Planctomycetota bacterium]